MKNFNKLNITIGIPAFNEEANIGRLINSILSQTEVTISVNQIIVNSDGSTDKTEKIVSSIKSKKITLIKGKNRIGKSARVNQIITKATGDVIVFLDADVVLAAEHTIENLVKPFGKQSNLGAVCGLAIAVNGTTLVERSVNVSLESYHRFIYDIDDGNTAHVWEGRIFALSNKLAKSIKIPIHILDDAYFYFVCKKRGYDFKFVKNASVYFRSPTTFRDQVKQNKRFNSRLAELYPYFGGTVYSSYYLPRKLYYRGLLSQLFKTPVLSTTIFSINMYSKLLAKLGKNANTGTLQQRWEIIASTKGEIKYE